MPIVTPSLSGKTCLITGATSGIGTVTARVLAGQGARILAVGRDSARVQSLLEDLNGQSAGGHIGLVADLSSQAELRRLAEKIIKQTPRLDLLINNAGAMSFERVETVDGFELTFALNHMAYFTLTNLLLDLLRSSAPARIINVASDAHHKSRGIPFDDLDARRSYGGWKRYCDSKLANVLFTTELARRLVGSNVTANSLHPGFVRTRFMDKSGLRWWAMRVGAQVFAISAEEGAKTTIHLAASPDVAEISGGYFARCRQVNPSRQARDDAAARRLWELSAKRARIGD